MANPIHYPRPHNLQAGIEAQGETVRKLKAEKADAAAVKAAVDKLLALKVSPSVGYALNTHHLLLTRPCGSIVTQAEYKQATGEDYKAPGAAGGGAGGGGGSKDKKKEKAPAAGAAPQPERTGPSKKELNKAAKMEKKAAAKQEGGGPPAGAGNGGKPAGAAAAAGAGGAPAGASVSGVKEPTLYPGEESETTHTVLAVAQAGGVKLARGYGSKPGFVGQGPFLELPGGEVVSGVDGVVRAVALVC